MLGEKTVVITGGTGALGNAVVESFQTAGANVVVSGRNAESLRRWQESSTLLSVRADLLDESSTRALMETARARFGRVDALLCLAGGFFGDTPVAETSPTRLREQLEVNLPKAD